MNCCIFKENPYSFFVFGFSIHLCSKLHYRSWGRWTALLKRHHFWVYNRHFFAGSAASHLKGIPRAVYTIATLVPICRTKPVSSNCLHKNSPDVLVWNIASSHLVFNYASTLHWKWLIIRPTSPLFPLFLCIKHFTPSFSDIKNINYINFNSFQNRLRRPSDGPSQIEWNHKKLVLFSRFTRSLRLFTL